MGILDQILGGGAAAGSPQAARNRSVNSKLAAGVLLALAVKAMRDRGKSAAGPSAQQPAGPDQAGGGILGGLGGLLGSGGGLGGILGGLGGAGALGGLIGALQQKGLHNEATSWVGTGANHPVAPHQLADALGDDTIKELQEQTGLPREQLLSDLAQELPQAVDAATPDGRLPHDDDELSQVAGR